MTDNREPAARAAVDAGDLFLQVANDYGLDSAETHSAQRAAEDRLRAAQTAGCTSLDYDNARHRP